MSTTHEETGTELYLKGERSAKHETFSGIPLKSCYDPTDVRDLDYDRDLGHPGQYPYTRGVHADMYRGRLWSRRQITGYGGPRETNQRIKFLFATGQTGLNLVPDLASAHGFDPDHARAEGEVGIQGVSISTLREMEELLDGLPVEKISTTLIARPPCAPAWLAFYIAAAAKRGVGQDQLMGTIHNDPLFQMAGATTATNTRFIPLDMALRLCVDTIEYCARHMPRFNTPCVNGYNVRETGVSAVHELAIALAAAIEFAQRTVQRGVAIDSFAPRISFFMASNMDFFEEAAKFRAARRMWAKIMRERFGAQDERSWRFRFSCQTAGVSLTAQQPLNNIIRVTTETLSAVLGGAQAVQATCFDEALSLPTEQSERIAIRTSQIIGYETGVANVVDPLAGSYFVEQLTNTVEEETNKVLARIEEMGGLVAAIKAGWLDWEVEAARAAWQRQLDSGERIVVGLNKFLVAEEEMPFELHRHSSQWEEERKAFLARLKAERDNAQVEAALRRINQEARQEVNLLPAIVAAATVDATLGEISDAIRDAYSFKV